MNTTRKTLGTIAVLALAVASTAAFAVNLGVDLAGMLGLHSDLFGGLGLLLANGILPIAKQIEQFEAKLASAREAANDIVGKSITEGRTLDEHESEQHAEQMATIKSLETHIQLLKDHEEAMKSKATPVGAAAGRETGEGAGGQLGAAAAGGAGSALQLRGAGAGSGVIAVKRNLPPGIAFTRFAGAMARAKGNLVQAVEIASQVYKDTPEVAACLKAAMQMGSPADLSINAKAAVPFGTTTDSAFAGPLVQYNDMEREFVELLRPATIIGRMQGLRRVPFMMRTARQLTGVSGGFVGEGAPKPVGRQTYDNVTLGFAKAAVIVVLSDELVRFSTPDAEMRARDDMIKGIGTFLDQRFIDPAFAGIPNVSPASITNGATRYQASGTTLDAIDIDVAKAMAMFAAGNVDPGSAVWVMPATVALRLMMKRNPEGQRAFPEIRIDGGTWYGLPVIVSNAMQASGSPNELQIALIAQDEVFLADEGGVSIDVSMEASVQMNDAPSAGAQPLVSLWQNNLIGLRAERYINWAPRRPNSLGIALIENVNY